MLVTCILVRPQHPGNIGSCARALANFGISSLRLVAPRVPPDHLEARRLAVGGLPVLERARAYPTLTAALHGCHLVVGTSRRRGKTRSLQPVATLRELLQTLTPRQRVAILFGSEEHGLHNDDLARCHHIVNIPSAARCPSLNLAHAVAVVAYELSRVERGQETSPGQGRATARECEQMFVHLQTALDAISFFPHSKPTSVMQELRACLARAQLTPQEVRVFRGIARQILWGMRGSNRT